MHGRSARTLNFLVITISEKYFNNGRIMDTIFWIIITHQRRKFSPTCIISQFHRHANTGIPGFPVRHSFLVSFVARLDVKVMKNEIPNRPSNLDPTFISITWEEQLTPLDLGWPQIYSFDLYTYEKRLIFNWTEIQYENRIKTIWKKWKFSAKDSSERNLRNLNISKTVQYFFRSQTNKNIKQ